MQQAAFPKAIEQTRQQIMATDFEAASSDDNEIMFTFWWVRSACLNVCVTD